jgi:phage-related protein
VDDGSPGPDQARLLDGVFSKGPEGLAEGCPSRCRLCALFAAQRGEEYRSVKALKGFSGRSVLEIVAPHDGDTYRAVYTVKFEDAVYVLHAFQKKSTKGIATPQREIDLIRRRLADAEQHYRERQTGHGEEADED